MDIETVKISDLNPSKYNPRKDLSPGDLEYEHLKASISRFDYIDPLVVNKRGNVVIGGHQRLKILIDLGYDEIDVSLVDLDEDDEKELNLVLNKVEGGWDDRKLAELLEDIGDKDVIGFSDKEIEGFRATLKPFDLDDVLKEADLKSAIPDPLWVVIRTGRDNMAALDEMLKGLPEGANVERSYGG